PAGGGRPGSGPLGRTHPATGRVRAGEAPLRDGDRRGAPDRERGPRGPRRRRRRHGPGPRRRALELPQEAEGPRPALIVMRRVVVATRTPGVGGAPPGDGRAEAPGIRSVLGR